MRMLDGIIGLYLSIMASAVVLLSLVGSVFYVAFSTKANSDALLLQAVVPQSLGADIRALQIKQNTLDVGLNEIETQFCAQDIVRNLMHANDMRNVTLLWEKTFGMRLSTDNAYYPTICNRRVKP